MKRKKHIRIRNGSVERPVTVGERAVIGDCNQERLTSRVVSVKRRTAKRIVIETQNTVYSIRLVNPAE